MFNEVAEDGVAVRVLEIENIVLEFIELTRLHIR